MTKKQDTTSKNGSSNGNAPSQDNDEVASVRSKYRALDYWIRTYCTPGKINPANAECAHGSELAALNDLKSLLGFGSFGDFATLAATYCRVRGGFEEKDCES